MNIQRIFSNSARSVIFTLFMLFVLTLLGIVGSIGCNQSDDVVENMVKITANPVDVVNGQQSRLTVNILNKGENGYDINYKSPNGEIQGGDDYQIMTNRHTAIYTPAPYYGDKYRLDTVSVDVSSLDGYFIGSDTVTIKVKAEE